MKIMIELRAESRRDAEVLSKIAELLFVKDPSGFVVIYLDETEARHLGFTIPNLFSLIPGPGLSAKEITKASGCAGKTTKP